MHKRTQRTHRRGATAMEFSLWLPILFLMVSAVMDWGSYMSTRVNVARATMDGCRVGSAVFEPLNVAPGSMSVPRATARTTDILSGLGFGCGAGCTVIAQYCQDGSGGACLSPPFDALLVTTTFSFTPFFGFARTPNVITETFLMATENQREPD